MNPTVEAALIAAGTGAVGVIGTVVVSIVGSRNTRQTTLATISASHNARVWEKQAAAYEEAAREVLARQSRRMAITSRGDIGNVQGQPIQEIFKSEEPEIIRIRAALRPYASAEVWAAYKVADEASIAFWVSLTKLASAHYVTEDRGQRMQQGVTDDELPPDPDYQGALDAMYAARSAAGDADDAFFEVVNRELAWQGPSDRTRRAMTGRRATPALAWAWRPGRRRAHHSPSPRQGAR